MKILNVSLPKNVMKKIIKYISIIINFFFFVLDYYLSVKMLINKRF